MIQSMLLRPGSPWILKDKDSGQSWDMNLGTFHCSVLPCCPPGENNLQNSVFSYLNLYSKAYAFNKKINIEIQNVLPDKAARCDESDKICPFIGSVIPDPVLELESGDTECTVGAASAVHDGDKLDPDPVEPGEVVGTPVNWK